MGRARQQAGDSRCHAYLANNIRWWVSIKKREKERGFGLGECRIISDDIALTNTVPHHYVCLPADCQHGTVPQILTDGCACGLITKICHLICLPASGACLLRWPSDDTVNCPGVACIAGREEEKKTWEAKLKRHEMQNGLSSFKGPVPKLVLKILSNQTGWVTVGIGTKLKELSGVFKGIVWII